jgi:hypothetical protein
MKIKFYPYQILFSYYFHVFWIVLLKLKSGYVLNYKFQQEISKIISLKIRYYFLY